MAELEVLSYGQNVAPNGTAIQSHPPPGGQVASWAIDSSTKGGDQYYSLAVTEGDQPGWWELDLGKEIPVESIQIWRHTQLGRKNGKIHHKPINMEAFKVVLMDANKEVVWSKEVSGKGDPFC